MKKRTIERLIFLSVFGALAGLGAYHIHQDSLPGIDPELKAKYERLVREAHQNVPDRDRSNPRPEIDHYPALKLGQ